MLLAGSALLAVKVTAAVDNGGAWPYSSFARAWLSLLDGSSVHVWQAGQQASLNLSDPFERLLTHGLAQYNGLRSKPAAQGSVYLSAVSRLLAMPPGLHESLCTAAADTTLLAYLAAVQQECLCQPLFCHMRVCRWAPAMMLVLDGRDTWPDAQ